jgi:hypothetical protein
MKFGTPFGIPRIEAKALSASVYGPHDGDGYLIPEELIVLFDNGEELTYDWPKALDIGYGPDSDCLCPGGIAVEDGGPWGFTALLPIEGNKVYRALYSKRIQEETHA